MEMDNHHRQLHSMRTHFDMYLILAASHLNVPFDEALKADKGSPVKKLRLALKMYFFAHPDALQVNGDEFLVEMPSEEQLHTFLQKRVLKEHSK